MQIFVVFKFRSMQIFNLVSEMTLQHQRMRFGFPLNVRFGDKRPTFSKCVSMCAMSQRTSRRGLNTGRSSSSRWSSTKCEFQDLEQVFGDWKCRTKIGQGRKRATSNKDSYLMLTARRHLNTIATLRQHLSSATGTTITTLSEIFTLQICMLADYMYGVCLVNRKSPQSSQGVGDRACTLEKK